MNGSFLQLTPAILAWIGGTALNADGGRLEAEGW
jgi:hypothetical protein